MTKTDCSRATGISVPTITKAVRNEELEAYQTKSGRWYILPAALLAWSKQKWKEERCFMFPTYYTIEFILTFHAHELSQGLREQYTKEAAAEIKNHAVI